MKPNQNTTQELNRLFSYYPADLIEAAFFPLLPSSTCEINEHTDILQLFYAELNEIIQGNLSTYQKANVTEITDISENHAIADAHAVISILEPIIPLGYIFFQQGKLDSASLTIVLDKHSYKPADDVREAIHFSLMAYPRITFELHNYGTMADMISNGHFYYATLCTRKNCIHQKEAQYSLPSPNAFAWAAARLNATTLFTQNTNKAISFVDGAKHYLAQNEHTMSVFMLQQACEFMYRGLIMIFKGKNIKSHELLVLRKHLIHHLPEVIGLFHPKPKKELRLLTLLQEAYVKSRYENTYQIEQEQCLELLAATSNLMNGVQTLFEGYLAETVC